MDNFVVSDLVLDKLCFSPVSGTTFCEKLSDCYRQLTESFRNKAITRPSIIKQTIFIATSSDSEYFQGRQELISCGKKFFTELPPTTILPQTPEIGSLAVEFSFFEGLQPDEIIYKQNSEASWLIILHGTVKVLVAAGLGGTSESGNILMQSNNAFEQLKQILAEEKMEFSDILRQWNYIEQITGFDNASNSPSQHYQIFNDVRSKYYQESQFENGYPAATGIGMDRGGIMIDVVAASFADQKSVIAIKSPVQLDAYTYSEQVLAENHAMCDFCRTTPKFERAKIIVTTDKKWIFISGTAAISGQESARQHTIEDQTKMTIQNILRLISVENINKHGIQASENASIISLRVYVKFKNDIPKVKEVCLQFFPEVPIVYVVADICRPELLVEIEGQALLN